MSDGAQFTEVDHFPARRNDINYDFYWGAMLSDGGGTAYTMSAYYYYYASLLYSDDTLKLRAFAENRVRVGVQCTCKNSEWQISGSIERTVGVDVVEKGEFVPSMGATVRLDVYAGLYAELVIADDKKTATVELRQAGAGGPGLYMSLLDAGSGYGPHAPFLPFFSTTINPDLRWTITALAGKRFEFGTRNQYHFHFDEDVNSTNYTCDR